MLGLGVGCRVPFKGFFNLRVLGVGLYGSTVLLWLCG